MTLLVTSPVFAQDISRQKIDQLVLLLSDPEIKDWLARQKTETGDPVTPPSSFTAWENAKREHIDRVIASVPAIPAEVAAVAARIRNDAQSSGFAPVVAVMIAIMLLGAATEVYLRRRWRRAGIVGELLPIAALATTMALVFLAIPWPPFGRIMALAYLSAFSVYRVLAIGIGALIEDRSIRRHAKICAAIAIVAITSSIISGPLGVDPFVQEAISYLSSLLLLALVLREVWTISGRQTTTRLALSLCVVLVWLMWCVGFMGLFWLGVYAFVLPTILRTVNASARSRWEAPASGGLHRVFLLRLGQAVVIGAATIWLAIVWRTDVNSLVHSNPVVEAALYGILKSVFVVLLADLVWHLAKAWIDEQLRPIGSGETTDHPAQATRLHTLLPLFRNALGILVIVVTGLTVLSELGVEIAPLLAGAGIFGVALGFGSQTLVKDIISGVFYMLDDAFRVGEYIQAKNFKGTVEGFSLRSVRLRHHRGPIFTVPFGELGAVENMSRDWAVVKFMISVGYDTDVAKVKALTKEIGKELRKDPEFETVIIENLKMKGVEKFGDYGIDLSFGMTLRPSALQSMIRRRANVMIREAFRVHGIEFATPSVQVGGDRSEAAAAAGVTAARVQQVRSATETAESGV